MKKSICSIVLMMILAITIISCNKLETDIQASNVTTDPNIVETQSVAEQSGQAVNQLSNSNKEKASEFEVKSTNLPAYTVETYNNKLDFVIDNGANLLDGLKPVIKSQGELTNIIWGDVKELISKSNKFNSISVNDDLPITITYDMGKSMTVDKVIVGGHFDKSLNFSFGTYEIYFSDNEKNLYEVNNRVVSYNNSGRYNSNIERSGADQLIKFNQKPIGRYFGIKFITLNHLDNILYLSRLAVYNDTYTQNSRYLNPHGLNILLKAKASLIVDKKTATINTGKKAFLNDGVLFEKNQLLEIDTKGKALDISYDLGKKKDIDQIIIAGSWDNSTDQSSAYQIYASSKKNELFHISNLVKGSSYTVDIETKDQTDIHILKFKKPISYRYFGIKYVATKKVIVLEEIGIFNYNKNVSVNSKKIINNNFLGYGVNALPMALMQESLNNGYKEAFWEVEAKRINTVKPKVARVWFQVDWMETTKGVYNFNSPKMKAFYKYLDAFQAAGTEIEFNFGWKNGNTIRNWFPVPNVDSRNAAPKDLEAFANSCSAVLKELIMNRGYTNVKYLAFYNEPNLNDFEIRGDQKAYFVEMVKKVDAKLRKDNIRNLVEIWGPEESGGFDWYQYSVENLKGVIDGLSFHVYGGTVTQLANAIDKRIKISNNIPVHLTEFGLFSADSTWEASNVANSLTAANAGASSALFWSMSGVTITDPLGWTMNDGDRHLWGPPQRGLETVHYNYYEFGLMNCYVPGHSKVLTVNNSNDDIRMAVFETIEGDYTIVVQAKRSDIINRNINVKFDKSINKTFHKFVYNNKTVRNAEAILPTKSADISVNNVLSDKIGSEYGLIIYTTLKPQTQVKMDKFRVDINAGDSIKLGAGVLDNVDGVEWSVASGGGNIDQNGTYVSDRNASRNTIIAVKATSKADPTAYGITLVYIR